VERHERRANGRQQTTRDAILSASAQQRYSSAFDVLLPYFPQIVASFSAVQAVAFLSELGEYAISRVINGENRIFFIYFGRDSDGVWRLQSM
jgi:hypothetical protein